MSDKRPALLSFYAPLEFGILHYSHCCYCWYNPARVEKRTVTITLPSMSYRLSNYQIRRKVEV